MADEINPVPVPVSPEAMKLADALKERASAALLGADIFVCDICGSIIADVLKHAMWHEALNTHRHETASSMVLKESITVHRHPRPGADYAQSGEYRAPATGHDGTDVFERPINVVTDVPAQFPTPPQRPALLGKRL